jgi:hypothetical protein
VVAVCARACERVLGFAGGVAGYLGEGASEVCVICLCLFVVEFLEIIVFVFVGRVGGYGIGDRVAEIEVENNLACAVCKSVSILTDKMQTLSQIYIPDLVVKLNC